MKAALLFLLAFVASAALAAPAPSVFLEDLTWPEVRDRVAAGSSTIIIPIGGTEQNGPHMALGKHNVRARSLAGSIARELGDALVAPVVAYVPEGNLFPPTEHMRFPGTITVPADVFERTLEAAARSFRVHGFKDIVFLGDHGGYQRNLKRVAERLNRDWARSGIRVHVPDEYYDSMDRAFAKELRTRNFTRAEIGVHAGLADTALALAIDPSLVRADLLASGGDANGARGDPRRATAELGEIGVKLAISRTVEAIRKSRRR